jgi:GR25 family glycosyltransferase involved in LPS biosynthesis
MDSDIYLFPLYYIGFNRNLILENNLKLHGFKNVNYFEAVDGRIFNIRKLLDNNIITIRSFNDLMLGREEHSGIPSLGAIGCTLSHYMLWKLCIDKNLPYIIILEDDCVLNDIITTKNLNDIITIISKPNGIFVSTNVYKDNNVTKFIGNHFNIVSKGACKELVKCVFPIDVQTDFYISHLNTIGKINLDGFSIAKQKRHISSIQEYYGTCVKCNLPKSMSYYIGGIISMVSIIIITIIITILALKY